MDSEDLREVTERESEVRLTAQLEALRRRLAELEGIEDRCHKAEAALNALEERNRLLGDAAPMGILVADVEGQVMFANGKMLELLALPSAVDARTINIFRIPHLLECGIADRIQSCVAKRETVICDHLLNHSEEETKSIRYHISPVIDTLGKAIAVMAFVEDITELKRVEQALRESEKRYRALFHSAPVAMIERDASDLKNHIEGLKAAGVADLEAHIVDQPEELSRCLAMIRTLDYNSAFAELMDLENGQMPGNGFGMADPQRLVEVARDIVRVMAEGHISNEAERVFVTGKGKVKSVLSKFLAVSGYEATLSRVVIALVDISRRKQAEEALRASEQKFRDQAMRDELTGLYNRRYLFRSLSRWIESGREADSQISIIFMDIDHFKDVVDTYGHLNGSQAIREVAGTIQECLENPAFAVAYAGDEFVAVLPDCDAEQARAKASEIREKMRHRVYLRDKNFRVSLQASFGVATFPDHAGDLEMLLARADQALFAVKQHGKDGVCCFEELAAELRG